MTKFINVDKLKMFANLVRDVKQANPTATHYVCVEIAKVIWKEAKKVVKATFRNLKALAYQISLDSLKAIILDGSDDKLAWECFNLKKRGEKFSASKIDFKPLFNRTYN